MRVVFADDSDVTRPFVRKILRRAGHEVVAEGSNGLEAVNACAEHRPDLVILDISMPGMSGDVAAQKILDAGTARHVIMASSQAQLGILQPLLDRGCAFLGKPYQPETMLPILAEIASRAE